MSGVEIVTVSSEFDIFALTPIQNSVLGTAEPVHKPIVSVDVNDLEL
jgi:hypothetical protein